MFELDATSPDGFKDCTIVIIFNRQLRFAELQDCRRRSRKFSLRRDI